MDAPSDMPSRGEPAKPASEPSAAAPDASAAAPEPSPPRRRGGGVSLLGIATACLGIVLAVLGIATLIVGRDSSVSALDARLAGLELHLRELAARPAPASADPKILEEVAGRLAKLEAAAGARSALGDAALADRLAKLETELKLLAETVGALGRRNEEILAAAREARARADAGAAALAELAQKIPDASAAVRSE